MTRINEVEARPQDGSLINVVRRLDIVNISEICLWADSESDLRTILAGLQMILLCRRENDDLAESLRQPYVANIDIDIDIKSNCVIVTGNIQAVLSDLQESMLISIGTKLKADEQLQTMADNIQLG